MKLNIIHTLLVLIACAIATALGKGCICTDQYDPVCASNNVLYGNSCRARCAGQYPPYNGNCPGITSR